MKAGDLTTLLNVKAWLSTTDYTSTGTGVDVTIAALVTRWSQAILGELERPWILPRIYSRDTYDGDGGTHQFMRNWPVISIQQLAINGRIIPESPIVPGGLTGSNYGWRFEAWDGVPPGGPQAIDVVGTCYQRGKQNVQISYTAGYIVQDEAQIIPSAVLPTLPKLTVQQPYGIWAQDNGVTYADTGLALTPVTAAPTAAGTYQVIQPDSVQEGGDLNPPGQYVFFTDDISRPILISYGFIPGALEQICIELVVERMQYRTRVGELSRTINNQVTAKYDDKEFPNYVKPVLQRYRSILPI